jgi:hypothetical protein
MRTVGWKMPMTDGTQTLVALPAVPPPIIDKDQKIRPKPRRRPRRRRTTSRT